MRKKSRWIYDTTPKKVERENERVPKLKLSISKPFGKKVSAKWQQLCGREKKTSVSVRSITEIPIFFPHTRKYRSWTVSLWSSFFAFSIPLRAVSLSKWYPRATGWMLVSQRTENRKKTKHQPSTYPKLLTHT